MAEKRQLEFFVLRYVPNAVRGECINIGVAVIAADGTDFTDVRFTRNWRRARCLDPDIDIEVLEALESDLRKELSDVAGRDSFLKRLSESLSNSIQMSSVGGCLSSEPANEADNLMRLFVEPLQYGVARVARGRQEILVKMRDAFEQAGVLKMMPRLDASPYTKKGDPMKLDFAYRVGDSIKIFHAVSLMASVSQAVILASRYPAIQSGIRSVAGADSLLTAVVDDGLDRTSEQTQFALGMMEEARIRIEAAAQMPAIAEMARIDLKL